MRQKIVTTISSNRDGSYTVRAELLAQGKHGWTQEGARPLLIIMFDPNETYITSIVGSWKEYRDLNNDTSDHARACIGACLPSDTWAEARERAACLRQDFQARYRERQAEAREWNRSRADRSRAER